MAEKMTQILGADADSIHAASQILTTGGLVAFPTETVYGLGADARNGLAVANIYAAKNRPSFNPLIIHVANIEIAKNFAVFDALSLKLASIFWPGPLSIVLPLRPNHGLSDLVTAGLDTIAIRIPQNEIAQSLLIEFGGPIAAPSANPSGRISPTKSAHVKDDMTGLIDAIIDGGNCAVGLESTIIKITDENILLLRAGGVSIECIEQEIGCKVNTTNDPEKPQSPGQLQSHYAPHAKVRLNATSCDENEVLLGFGPSGKNAELNLSCAGDLHEAAANLFSYLRKMDAIAKEKNAHTITVNPIENKGLGVAINDRLNRAATPRN